MRSCGRGRPGGAAPRCRRGVYARPAPGRTRRGERERQRDLERAAGERHLRDRAAGEHHAGRAVDDAPVGRHLPPTRDPEPADRGRELEDAVDVDRRIPRLSTAQQVRVVEQHVLPNDETVLTDAHLSSARIGRKLLERTRSWACLGASLSEAVGPLDLARDLDALLGPVPVQYVRGFIVVRLAGTLRRAECRDRCSTY